MKNYYSILEINKKSSQKEIKKAFRKLSMKYHPDKNPGDKKAERKMVEINEAYAVLGKEKNRKKYDQQFSSSSGKKSKYPHSSPFEKHRRSKQYKNAQEFYKDYDFESFGDFINRNSNRFNNTFGEMFGVNDKASDMVGEIYITPEQAQYGCSPVFKFERVVICPYCYGNCVNHDFINCSGCQGEGQMIDEKKLRINIPPGTPNGGKIRLSEQGENGNGKIPGDLILTIVVTENGSQIKRDDLDFHQKKTIKLDKAVSGGPVTIQSPNGPLRIMVPKMVYPGKKIRVKNEGFKDLVTDKKGHVYVTFNVEFPKDPTRSEQHKIEKILSKTK